MPSFDKKKVKIDLSSIKTALDIPTNKKVTKEDSLTIKSSREYKSSFNKIKSRNHHKSIINEKPYTTSHALCYSNGAKRQKNFDDILTERVMREINDDLIGYTNPSPELTKTVEENDGNMFKEFIKEKEESITPLISFQNETDDLEIIQKIRNFQTKADQKLQEFYLKHITHKFLMQNSARIIQRAWRRYQTTKIVKDYCSKVGKLTKKSSGIFKTIEKLGEKKNLNVKSYGMKQKHGKNEIQKAMEKRKEYFKDIDLKENQEKCYLSKKMQVEEIREWEDVTKGIEIKMNETQKLKAKGNEKISSKDESYREPKHTINLKEHTNSEECNKNKSKHVELKENSDFDRVVFSPDCSNYQTTSVHHNNSKKEEILSLKIWENDEIKAKIEENVCFSPQEEETNEENVSEIISQELLLEHLEILSSNIETYHLKEKVLEAEELETPIKPISEKLRNPCLLNNILPIILNHLVEEALWQMEEDLEFSQAWLKFSTPNSYGENFEEPEKTEGICTNLESIKEYLENMVSYVLEECPLFLIEGFNTPLGPSSESLLYFFRNKNSQPVYYSTNFGNEDKEVIAKELFMEHWLCAEKEIYFERKYDDKQKEIERIDYLKSITKMYFELIFDSFNECLSSYRKYGLQGAPFLWENRAGRNNKIETLFKVKLLIKNAFKKLSEFASIFCGLLVEDKQANICKEMMMEIKEERMGIYLENEILGSEWRNDLNIERAEMSFEIANQIMQDMIKEEILEISTCFNSKNATQFNLFSYI